MKYPELDWMIIEAFEQGDTMLYRNYWEAVELEKAKRGEELAEEIRKGDETFKNFLIQSGVIDQTLQYLFEKHKTPEAVKQQIRKNNLDKLARHYDLQKEFNNAYKKYKAVSK